MANFYAKAREAARLIPANEDRAILAEGDKYRAALEKSAYGDAGREYGMGLDSLNNLLARSGPIADSGAGTLLRSKLLANIYGQSQGRIQGGYADYLRNALEARRNFRYQ